MVASISLWSFLSICCIVILVGSCCQIEQIELEASLLNKNKLINIWMEGKQKVVTTLNKLHFRDVGKECESSVRMNIFDAVGNFYLKYYEKNAATKDYFEEKAVSKTTFIMFDKNNEIPIEPITNWFTKGKIFNDTFTRRNIENLKRELNKNCLFKKKIIFIVHGFLSSNIEEWVHQIASAFYYKNSENTIIITVGWNLLHRNMTHKDYLPAMLAIFEVAERIYNVIQSTIGSESCPISLANFMLVGHSLGAQTCGLIGFLLKNNPYHQKLRIIGLDPAGPLYLVGPECLYLDREDAGLVEIIHTSSALGSSIHRGHVDHYINGGVHQKECLQRYSKMTVRKWIDVEICSHSMATAYLARCIRNPSLCVSFRCSNYDNFMSLKCFNESRIRRIGDFDFVPPSPPEKFFFDTLENGKFGNYMGVKIVTRSPSEFGWFLKSLKVELQSETYRPLAEIELEDDQDKFLIFMEKSFDDIEYARISFTNWIDWWLHLNVTIELNTLFKKKKKCIETSFLYNGDTVVKKFLVQSTCLPAN